MSKNVEINDYLGISLFSTYPCDKMLNMSLLLPTSKDRRMRTNSDKSGVGGGCGRRSDMQINVMSPVSSVEMTTCCVDPPEWWVSDCHVEIVSWC